ncbi:hypothetical protein SO802_020225 [Lithocarpus litseifolius]|uniref:Uncharacterized protein n=1 Tax=Lithocarpus litseifolius TaxID=425828 RepID=A0AAW2CFD9_9ROSI
MPQQANKQNILIFVRRRSAPRPVQERGAGRVPDQPLMVGRVQASDKDGYRGKKVLPQRSRSIVSSKQKVWIPPKLGDFKTNFDDAMFSESDNVGIGIVVRNSVGNIINALSEKIHKSPFVEIMELH